LSKRSKELDIREVISYEELMNNLTEINAKLEQKEIDYLVTKMYHNSLNNLNTQFLKDLLLRSKETKNKEEESEAIKKEEENTYNNEEKETMYNNEEEEIKSNKNMYENIKEKNIEDNVEETNNMDEEVVNESFGKYENVNKEVVVAEVNEEENNREPELISEESKEVISERKDIINNEEKREQIIYQSFGELTSAKLHKNEESELIESKEEVNVEQNMNLMESKMTFENDKLVKHIEDPIPKLKDSNEYVNEIFGKTETIQEPTHNVSNEGNIEEEVSTKKVEETLNDDKKEDYESKEYENDFNEVEHKEELIEEDVKVEGVMTTEFTCNDLECAQDNVKRNQITEPTVNECDNKYQLVEGTNSGEQSLVQKENNQPVILNEDIIAKEEVIESKQDQYNIEDIIPNKEEANNEPEIKESEEPRSNKEQDIGEPQAAVVEIKKEEETIFGNVGMKEVESGITDDKQGIIEQDNNEEDNNESEYDEAKRTPSFTASIEHLKETPNEAENIQNKGVIKNKLSEDQIVEIAQGMFSQIAEQMVKKGLDISELFAPLIREVEDEEVILTQDFLKVIESLEIQSLDKLKCECLVKVLAVNDKQEFIKLDDFMEIMSNFAVTGVPGENSRMAFLIMQNMNAASMILMFALTEFIIKNNVPLYDIFGTAIRKEVIEDKAIEFIKSAEFFSILTKIGLESDEADYENLKKFLCISKDKPNTIELDKLKETINEFAINDKLQEAVSEYYKQLLDSQGDELINENPE